MSSITSNTILIVDDNVGARRSIEALLSNEPYRLLLASSGKEAIELAQKEPPDLMLLDVMMPGMNGFEVCDTIRKDSRISEIPIIMITALDDDESMIRGIDVGADDFLSKPINKIELRSRVKGILRLNRYRKICDERKKFELVVENSKFGYVVINSSSKIEFANPTARQMLKIADYTNESIDFFEQVEKNYAIRTKLTKIKGIGTIPPKAGEPFILVKAQTQSTELNWIRATTLEISGSRNEQSLVRLEDITQNMLSFQEKHTFSRMISHKLLTPLNALKAAEQLMNRNAVNQNDNSVNDVSYLQKKGLARLEYDIHSILKFLESNSSPSPTPPSSKIIDLGETLKKIANDIGVNFKLIGHDRIANTQAIGISLYNFEACAREIVENAIKFHANRTPKIQCHIKSSNEDSEIHFEFLSDSEPLDEKELANAWKPYWQADRYFTGEIPGMGLGLSLIATNVWTAGGSCSIDNQENQHGVIVTLRFPIVAK